MRRLNFKLLLILLVASAALGGGILALNRYQVTRSAGRLGEQAGRALVAAEAASPAERGLRYQEAMELYARYLRYRPNDLDALASYGRLLADTAGTPDQRIGALATLARVQGSAKYADDPEVLRRMVRLSMSVERYGEAERLIDSMLDEGHPDHERWAGDAEMRRALAICREVRDQNEEAIAEYRRAMDLDPTDPTAPAQLSRLLRDAGKGEEADGILDQMVLRLEEAPAPQEAEARAELDRKRAQAHLVRAAQRILATPRTVRGKIPEAVASSAAADTARAIELAPDQVEPLIQAAWIAGERERSDWNEIRRVLAPALDRFPEEPRIYLALAEAYVNTQRLEEAVSTLERGRRATDDVDVIFALAALQIDQGNVDAPADVNAADRRNVPRRLVDELVRRSYPRALVSLLEARLIMADRDRDSRPIGDERWRRAARILREEVLSRLAPADPKAAGARRLLLACIDADPTLPPEEKVAQRSQLMEQVAVADDRQAADALSQMAATLASLGRHAEAARTYGSIPNPSAEVILARGRSELLAVLERPAADRDYSALEASLALLAKVAKDDPRVELLRADMLIARDDLGRAQAVLDAARRAWPERVEIWDASIRLAERRNQPQTVEQLIAGAEAQATSADRPLIDKVGAQLLRARQLGQRDDAEAVQRLDEMAAKVGAVAEADDRQRLLRGLVAAYAARGEPKRALGLWLAQMDQSGGADRLADQTIAFELALAAGDRAAQDRAIARMRSPQVEGESGVFWRMAQARQNIDQVHAMPEAERSSPVAKGLLNEARAQLEEVARQRANNPRVAVALGAVADLEGRAEEAINQYFTAFRLGETDLSVLRRTVGLLTESRRYAQARVVLESILRRSAMTPELGRLASQIAFHDRDYDRAIAQARAAVDKGSRDPLDYTWLAQLLLATGRRDEAAAMFRRAVQVAPERPEGHLTLIEFLAMTGSPELGPAVAAAERALAVTSPLGLAQCLELANRGDEADAIYRRLIGQAAQGPLEPDRLGRADDALLRNYATFLARRGRSNDARAVFEAILARASSTPERSDDRQWANSLLSLVLARDSDPSSSRRALTGLGLTADPAADVSGMAASEAPASLRTKARVLALQREPGYRRQATQILAKLHERRAADADDLLLLARLHELDKDWRRAQVSYRDAIDANPADLRPLMAYIQALLRRKEPAAAVAPWIDRLEKARGVTPLTVQMRALVLKNEKKDEQAIALITDFASKQPDQVPGAARVLELMGYAEPAESLLRPYAERTLPSDPGPTLSLAQMLGRRGRVAEALDLCEPLWSSPDPTAAAETSIGILLGHDDPESGRRVERWLQRAIDAHPEKTTLRALRGVLLFTLNRPAEAEEVYRALLEKEPSNPLVLNNLAWLLAFREGKADEALELINRALDRVGSNVPSLLDTRAVVRLARGEPSPAIRDLEMAIGGSAQDVDPGMYFHMARAQVMAGQDDEARRYWEDGRLLGLTRDGVDPAERAVYDELRSKLAGPTG